MSVPVPLEKLRAAIEERGGGAYLLTVSAEAAPHAVHVPVRWEGDALVAPVGKRSAANCTAHGTVSLLFPVREEGDTSLIVDGTAAVIAGEGDPAIRITPTKAVLHRPVAAVDPASSCGADCVPVLRSSDRSSR
jgi:hypothetical protein